MNEPMDDVNESNQLILNHNTLRPELRVEEGNPGKEVSALRSPSSMMMMSITIEEYEAQYWPQLVNAIDQLLAIIPGQYIPVSYEQVYSCVYKCVCKQLSERLYADLLQHITNHLERLNMFLQQFTQQASTQKAYVENFASSLNQYLIALQGIVPVFGYMNRFYIEMKLKTNLTQELKNLFVTLVADRHIEILITILDAIVHRPFVIQPAVLQKLMNNLYAIRPDYSQLRPQLFSRYITNVLPPCLVSEIDKYAQEAQQMQRDLMTHPDFFSGDQSRKRSFDDDSSPKLLMMNSPSDSCRS